jgi:hypothetical protein
LRQLFALEPAPFFRVEPSRGDDADRVFIVNLDVDNEEKPPKERITHDLHAVRLGVPMRASVSDMAFSR